MRSRLETTLLACLLLLFSAGCAAPATELPPPRTTYIGVTPAFSDRAYAWLQGFAPFDPTHELTLRILPLEAGIEAAQAGEIDFLISASDPPQDWFATPLETSAVLIVTPSNARLRDLTLRQLREIYIGQTTDWSELDAGQGQIQPMMYPEGDELRTAFEGFVMEGNRFSSNTRLLPDPASMAQAVAGTPGAIGVIPDYATITELHSLTLASSTPTERKISDSRYPLTVTVIAFAPSEPEGLARTWLGWIQAEE
ncbi:MAG: substrate-binding domain-containing protein [Anaerolineales bacterium]|jgi:ABC-type phosphate transport system substrate-binding protein